VTRATQHIPRLSSLHNQHPPSRIARDDHDNVCGLKKPFSAFAVLLCLLCFSPALAAASAVIGHSPWTDQTAAGSRNWQSITSSSDGTKLAAVEYGGDIWTSTNSGATWTDRSAAGSRNWQSITSSSDGTKLAAVDNNPGDIWTLRINQAVIAHSNTVALSSGLVGHWPLNGPATSWKTDTTQDTSGNGNTGTLVGMSTTTSVTPGVIGQALKFNGANSYISESTSISGIKSVAFWAKPAPRSPSRKVSSISPVLPSTFPPIQVK